MRAGMMNNQAQKGDTLSRSLFSAGSAVLAGAILAGCGAQSSFQPSSRFDEPSRHNALSNAGSMQESTIVHLLNGETVTIKSAQKPALLTPNDIPSNLAAIVSSNQAATTGRLSNIIPLLPASKSPPLPVPYNGRQTSLAGAQISPSARRRDGTSGAAPDHSARGWAYGSANDPVHPYYGQGFVELAVDVSAPTLYLNAPGDTVNAYVYYNPTVQGTDVIRLK